MLCGLEMGMWAVGLLMAIMNLLPWGGPTARAISVLKLNEQTVLRDLAPGMVVSIIYMLLVAFYLGVKERKRIGVQHLSDQDIKDLTTVTDPEELALKRPKKVWINAILTISIIVMLSLGFYIRSIF